MICAWQEFIRLIPPGFRDELNHSVKEKLQELRLRIGQPPKMVFGRESAVLNRPVTHEDLQYVINSASQYSPWASTTVNKGFITASGGHRIGVCGDCVVHERTVSGIRTPTSLCLRVARDFPGIAAKATTITGSVLIIGPPGSGKTTFLRDFIRQRAALGAGSVSVVDERGELFPAVSGAYCFSTGANTDVLSGCAKGEGIDMVLRTMGPQCIAVDEITEESDCQNLIAAAWSGVDLLATAHAATIQDLISRNVYRPLISTKLFSTVIVMTRDKQWYIERSGL